MGSEPTVTIVPNPDALADAAARLTVDVAAHAIATRGRFMWALAGGETPRTTYERLALPPFRERVDWRHTWVFFGDERAVPPDDAGRITGWPTRRSSAECRSPPRRSSAFAARPRTSRSPRPTTRAP